MTQTGIMTRKKLKLVALSSGGGHWTQLLRLRPAFEGCEIVYATVKVGYRPDVDDSQFRVIPDANRWNKFALIRSIIGIFWLLLHERPDIVVSTGAAPGYFGVLIGRFLGARTIWIDSIANAEVLSLSGQRVGRHADLWLTQWRHLATEKGPFFRGSVL